MTEKTQLQRFSKTKQKQNDKTSVSWNFIV